MWKSLDDRNSYFVSGNIYHNFTTVNDFEIWRQSSSHHIHTDIHNDNPS